MLVGHNPGQTAPDLRTRCRTCRVALDDQPTVSDRWEPCPAAGYRTMLHAAGRESHRPDTQRPEGSSCSGQAARRSESWTTCAVSTSRDCQTRSPLDAGATDSQSVGSGRRLGGEVASVLAGAPHRSVTSLCDPPRPDHGWLAGSWVPRRSSLARCDNRFPAYLEQK